jgi:uncharacterized membrane protein
VQIQLPHVMASIARDVAQAIEIEGAPAGRPGRERGLSPGEVAVRMEDEAGIVTASESGYLQYVRCSTLVRMAADTNAVIRLLHRPGHFLVTGRAIAQVWPPEAAPTVARSLRRAHITGPFRSLTQDISFGIDQLVEIAIRALSPAVNDTFTALTCVDWIGACLRDIALGWQPDRIHRDRAGYVRLITMQPSYDRLVQRAFEKIRQASTGMPAVMIRQLDALTEIMQQAPSAEQLSVLMEQGEMIRRLATETVSEPADLADVLRRHEILTKLHDARLDRVPVEGGAGWS